VPTLNEEKGIGSVVGDFRRMGYEVLVVDGGSKDKTREIAQENGARVILQTGKGKGNAISDAFKILDSDIVVLVDGDGSYPAEDLPKLLEPIKNGVADHVIGNRFHSYEKGAFTRLNLIGNKILNFFFRFAYGIALNDVLSGYRALKKELYKNIEIKKSGFEVEVELTVETLAKGFRIIEVPIGYRKREGKTKLKPLRDGFRIGKAIYEMLKRYSPARYIYLIGAVFIFLGMITGLYVVYEWLKGITHILLAMLTVLFILMGVQFFVFGLMTHLLFRSTIELKKEINELRKKYN
ncbi:MAG: S-layer glycoprotein N-glycosyltransferase AglJ, partial [Archaeoglobaceae archaeon]|nr:S-layer glycoprotein N-glycosyltransferase AglJ [Archaeoglobaceae archaeon]